jgi:hypothetical protein
MILTILPRSRNQSERACARRAITPHSPQDSSNIRIRLGLLAAAYDYHCGSGPDCGSFLAEEAVLRKLEEGLPCQPSNNHNRPPLHDDRSVSLDIKATHAISLAKPSMAHSTLIKQSRFTENYQLDRSEPPCTFRPTRHRLT